MQRVTLWQVRPAARGTLVELVGAFGDVPTARRALWTSIPRGAVVDVDGELLGHAERGQRGDLTRDERDQIERAAAAWRALPQPPAGRVAPAADPDPHEALGVGAATELPAATEAGSTLPAGDGLVREVLRLREDLARVTVERDAALRQERNLRDCLTVAHGSISRLFAERDRAARRRATQRPRTLVASPVLDLIEAFARRAR